MSVQVEKLYVEYTRTFYYDVPGKDYEEQVDVVFTEEAGYIKTTKKTSTYKQRYKKWIYHGKGPKKGQKWYKRNVWKTVTRTRTRRESYSVDKTDRLKSKGLVDAMQRFIELDKTRLGRGEPDFGDGGWRWAAGPAEPFISEVRIRRGH